MTSGPGVPLHARAESCTITAMLTAEHVRERIAAALPDADVEVVDTTGTGDHFAAQVIAAQFAGVSRLDQHRMVYDAVRDELADGSLHALELRTRARDEQ